MSKKNTIMDDIDDTIDVLPEKHRGRFIWGQGPDDGEILRDIIDDIKYKASHRQIIDVENDRDELEEDNVLSSNEIEKLIDFTKEEEIEVSDNKIKKAEKDMNLINSGKMTNLEKDELKSRIDGARPEERQVTIRRFTTDELYSEIGRRLRKGDNYIHDLKTLIDRYYDEDEDLNYE